MFRSKVTSDNTKDCDVGEIARGDREVSYGAAQLVVSNPGGGLDIVIRHRADD